MKYESSLRYSFNSPLQGGDTAHQTIGCRHSNPDICGSNGLDSVCAFARADHICKKTSAAWKKQYKKLADILSQSKTI